MNMTCNYKLSAKIVLGILLFFCVAQVIHDLGLTDNMHIVGILKAPPTLIRNAYRIFRPKITQNQTAANELVPTTEATPPGGTDLLILSYMGSGSSFAGRLLGYRQDTFYFFEPLWKLSAWGYFKGNEKVCVQRNIPCRNPFNLQDVYTIFEMSYRCNISRTLLQAYVQQTHITLSGPHWKSCLKLGISGCSQHLKLMCLKAKHRVTKVLRITMDITRRLLSSFQTLKVLHLVRDPRAILYSRSTTKWYSYLSTESHKSAIREAARGLCDKMRYDTMWSLKLKQEFPDRVKILQYEDILLHSNVSRPCIFYYTGMDAIQQEEGKRIKSYTWRNSLSWKFINIIEEECKEVINLLGYRTFENEEEFRNKSIPSMPTEFIYGCRR